MPAGITMLKMCTCMCIVCVCVSLSLYVCLDVCRSYGYSGKGWQLGYTNKARGCSHHEHLLLQGIFNTTLHTYVCNTISEHDIRCFQSTLCGVVHSKTV